MAEYLSSGTETDGYGSDSEEDLFLKEKDPGPQEQAQLSAEPLGKMKADLAGVNWMNIAASGCLWLAVLICSAAFSLLGPFFPQEALNNGASYSVVGVIISLAPLSVAVLSPLFGYLIPLVGITTYTLVGLLLVGCSYILLAFVIRIPFVWAFIVICMLLRIAEGVGTALFFTAAFSTFPKLFPNSVSLMMALFEVGVGLGNSIGRPLGGLLYSAGGYKLPFLTVGTLAIVISIPCLLLVRKMEIKRAENVLSWTLTLSIATDLYFIVLALAIVAGFLALSNQGPALQPYLIEKFHLNPFQISMMYFILATAFTLTNLPAGLVSNKLRSIYVSVFGLTVAVVGEFTVGIPEYFDFRELWIVGVSLAVTGIGGALAIVPVYANLLLVSERYLGKEESKTALYSFVSGIVSSSVSTGQFSGPLLSGLFTNFFSFPVASVLIGVIVMAEILLLVGTNIIYKFTWTQDQVSHHHRNNKNSCNGKN